MELCHNCGYENHKGRIVCIKCGELLENTSHKQQDAEKEQLRQLLEQI